MRCVTVFLPVFFWIGVLPAQQPPFSGPVEAFTFDVPTMSFRAVVGSLGSAFLGPAILSRFDYGSVAPHQDYGIAFRGDQCLLVSGLGSEQLSTTVLPGSFSLPEGVAWSGDGSVAVLYSRTGNWIQTITGLPASANPGASVSMSLLGGTLSTVAIDLHGEHIAIGVVGETAGVYQIAGGQSFIPLLPLSKPIALTFADDGGTLYALDGATGQLSELNMADLTSQTWPLDGLQDPSLVRSAYDAAHRHVIYVAGRSDRLLRVYDASSHQVVADIPLSFQPSVIEPLGRDSFLLGPRANEGDPLWSFTNASQPTVYFVPATPLTRKEDRSR